MDGLWRNVAIGKTVRTSLLSTTAYRSVDPIQLCVFHSSGFHLPFHYSNSTSNLLESLSRVFRYLSMDKLSVSISRLPISNKIRDFYHLFFESTLAWFALDIRFISEHYYIHNTSPHSINSQRTANRRWWLTGPIRVVQLLSTGINWNVCSNLWLNIKGTYKITNPPDLHIWNIWFKYEKVSENNISDFVYALKVISENLWLAVWQLFFLFQIY